MFSTFFFFSFLVSFPEIQPLLVIQDCFFSIFGSGFVPVCVETMEVWLVGLVRAAWIAATLPILIASIPSSRLRFVHEALMGFSKRGKTMQSSSYKFTVPQRFFCHFYVLAVVWTTLLLSMTWMYAYKMAPLVSDPSLVYSTLASHLTGGSHMFSFHKARLTPVEHRYMIWRSVFLLLLMEVQLMRRLLETFSVFSYSPSARMHIFGYLAGIFFYILAPLSLCCNLAPEVFKFAAEQVAEFIVKGKQQMAAFEFEWWEVVSPLIKLGWLPWIGAAIFLWGWIHQHRCHVILGSLREHPKQINEYVIYAGLLVASGGADLTIWLLFFFVVANLAFAAADTHRWYLQKFDNYPSNRRAIIPFVY
ncbi:hypothetical protein EZV62_011669 [Acer yangbiense]|uniref:3-oxo-5-alpha-steroid 4-dehydrogenase C-terminal domain-containing protein n=1 Tax=Acer yangbiense TaxID=1000413 RepID=A0A5C7I6C4_9ROSI|nr:hypothetical protein EZV62_011669 [Acer yangbiense]